MCWTLNNTTEKKKADFHVLLIGSLGVTLKYILPRSHDYNAQLAILL